MLRRAEVSLTCAFFLLPSCWPEAAHAQSKPSSDLLLPYFEVSLTEGGATTVLLVSNNLNKPVDVLAEVYSNWGVEVLEVRLRLKARELWTADLREWLVHGRLPGPDAERRGDPAPPGGPERRPFAARRPLLLGRGPPRLRRRRGQAAHPG